MYQFPSTSMPRQYDVPSVREWTSHDEDDLLDAWLSSLSASEFERVLNHPIEAPVSAAPVLDSTA